MKLFKLLHILRAKISPQLPNILCSVTSVQHSKWECKNKNARIAWIIQIYYNINMENCVVFLWVSVIKRLFSFSWGHEGPWPNAGHALTRAMAPSFTRFLNHSQRRATVGRTPLDEWSARRRDLYLTTHSNHKNTHQCPRWDSNPQSQMASCRRHTP